MKYIQERNGSIRSYSKEDAQPTLWSIPSTLRKSSTPPWKWTYTFALLSEICEICNGYLKVHMQKIHKRLAPDNITELSQCEIFVFGSNLEGQHMGGAARYAYDHFGAEWGNGVGPQGQCYAIPTMHGPLSEIKPYVDDFIEYARQHPMNRFLLTRIGCGIAGFKDKDMAPLFKEALKLPNVSFPNEWFIQLLDDIEPREKRKQAAPPIINMEVLQRLCQEFLYTIGAGIPWNEPDILIRYVIGEDKFGYKPMGNFFFLADTLYVWDFDDVWAPDHNADIVEEIFHDECNGRGYAHRVLFAGVKTPYKDSKGESIFTGDVCHIKFHGSEYDYPLSTLGSEENPEFFRYAFVLDNHCIRPEECESITRVGTVFYMLKPNDDGNMVDEKSAEFTDIYGQNPNPIEHRLEMAKYTPSFHENYWEYAALKVLEIEYGWRYYPGLPKPDED